MHDMWLIEEGARRVLQQVVAQGITPTAEQLAAFEARFGISGNSGPSILSISGNRANVEITGVLTKKPNWMAAIFGGGNTTYGDIISAIATAEANPDVKAIDLIMDTPGGAIDGMFDAMATISGAEKPVHSIVSNLAASAGFALASQANKIIAAGPFSVVGSIGVVAQFWVREDIATVTSTEAPDKAPDVSTDAGKKVVRAHLDDLHALFVEGIAEGRSAATGKKFDARRVNKNFGRGSVVLAAEALEKGMIDEISGEKSSVGTGSAQAAAPVETAEGGKDTEVKSMDLQKLKSDHPDVYTQAVEIGRTEERGRVEAHLILGKQSGAMEIAITAITEGTELTPKVQAQYMAAGMNKADTDKVTVDDVETGKALDNIDTAVGPSDVQAELIANTIAESVGLDVGEV